MAVGHIDFTLTICVCVCMCFCSFVCVFQNHVRPITSLCMVGFEYFLHNKSSRQDDVSRVRTMLPGHRSKSRLTLYVCAFQNQVRPITSFEKWWDLKIIWQKLSPRQDDMSHVIATSLGQRSVSKSTLTVFCIVIFCSAHNVITAGMVGFENYLAHMIIKTRRCVPVQEPCPYVNVQAHCPHLQLCIGVSETCS